MARHVPDQAERRPVSEDMVNLSRALDAAEVIALSHLNDAKGSNSRAGAPPVRLPRQGLSDQGAARFARVLARGRA